MVELMWCRRQGDHLILSLTVQPGAKSTEIVGVYGDTLKLRVQAAPVEGKANQVLLNWLARELGISRQALILMRGANTRRKQIAIAINESPEWIAIRFGVCN